MRVTPSTARTGLAALQCRALGSMNRGDGATPRGCAQRAPFLPGEGERDPLLSVNRLRDGRGKHGLRRDVDARQVLAGSRAEQEQECKRPAERRREQKKG